MDNGVVDTVNYMQIAEIEVFGRPKPPPPPPGTLLVTLLFLLLCSLTECLVVVELPISQSTCAQDSTLIASGLNLGCERAFDHSFSAKSYTSTQTGLIQNVNVPNRWFQVRLSPYRRLASLFLFG